MKDSLSELKINDCNFNIDGLKTIRKLKNLKKLKIYNNPRLKNDVIKEFTYKNLYKTVYELNSSSILDIKNNNPKNKNRFINYFKNIFWN